MRKLVSILIFSTTLFIGVFTLPTTQPTIYEEIYPLFSREEANLLLGGSVRNKYFSKEFVGMKCPLNAEENFVCEPVRPGETGEVFMLNPLPNGYGLLIRWDKQNEHGRDMFSYHGRFSSRLFLKFE